MGDDTRQDGRADLNEELDRLQEWVPHGGARGVRQVGSPEGGPHRIPMGVALMAGGVAGFLPILGFWMLPLGLAVIAHDVPVMQPPMARLLAKINGKRTP